MKYKMIEKLKTSFEQGKLVAYLYTQTLEEAEDIARVSAQTCEISEVLDEELVNEELNFIVKWTSTEAIDLLGKIDNTYFSMYLKPMTYDNLICNFKKSREDAVAPSKAHISDSGFDLTLLELVKVVGDVEMYTTGISVDPPHGYYFDMVPRSSISKTGYMLANNVGIIDQSYRGDVLVALRKVDKNAGGLLLPVKLVQLIPRQWHTMHFIEKNELDVSIRGDGGFGSTS